jgi:hypothetical protein
VRRPTPTPDAPAVLDPSDALAEACAWLRSLDRTRNGEDIAADLEKAFPAAATKLATAHPGYSASVPHLAAAMKATQ